MRTWNTMDKTAWLPGPWQSEPDKAQWVDEATGLDCLIKRNRLGALCGYVGVPEGHPAFGRDYNDVDARVHGGLTFADFCDEPDASPETWASSGDDKTFEEWREVQFAERICHIPETGRPDRVWWLGFDCGHAWDVAPEMLRRDIEGGWGYELDAEYRDIAFVRVQVARLAAQLAEMPTMKGDMMNDYRVVITRTIREIYHVREPDEDAARVGAHRAFNMWYGPNAEGDDEIVVEHIQTATVIERTT